MRSDERRESIYNSTAVASVVGTVRRERGDGLAVIEFLGHESTSMSTKYNFSPGPAILPRSVLEEAQRDLLALPGVGLSVLEISHRSAAFTEILERAQANLKQLLGIPGSHRILFAQGGASLQFSMVPLNFLRNGGHAEYIVTGSWGKKAVKEARKEGEVRVTWDGAETSYACLPTADQLSLNPGAAYLHFTSNETIEGVQFPGEPPLEGAPIVCDASSDILSRPIPVEKFGLIYAGAQKNAGPAGVTLIIIHEELLERGSDTLPTLLNYRNLAEHNSLCNTPPVFAIYMVMLTTQWLLDEYETLDAVDRRNQEKAGLLYEVIDASEGFYRGHAQPDCRSNMNVTFRLPDSDLEARFVKQAAAEGLVELKGHRSVGGMRASIYNAMPLEGVQSLRDFMRNFHAKHG